MTISRDVNFSIEEVADLLKNELMESCITDCGELNLSGSEERHLYELYRVLKPIGMILEAELELRSIKTE